MENCIFCKIIKGGLPSYKVWEDENHLAFLSIMPINPGHTLVIPKKHADYFYDLETQDLGSLMLATKPIAASLKKALKPAAGRIGVMIAGMGVPHVHVHLVPMNSEGDLTFARQKNASKEELQETLDKIKASLD